MSLHQRGKAGVRVDPESSGAGPSPEPEAFDPSLVGNAGLLGMLTGDPAPGDPDSRPGDDGPAGPFLGAWADRYDHFGSIEISGDRRKAGLAGVYCYEEAGELRRGTLSGTASGAGGEATFRGKFEEAETAGALELAPDGAGLHVAWRPEGQGADNQGEWQRGASGPSARTSFTGIWGDTGDQWGTLTLRQSRRQLSGWFVRLSAGGAVCTGRIAASLVGEGAAGEAVGGYVVSDGERGRLTIARAGAGLQLQAAPDGGQSRTTTLVQESSERPAPPTLRLDGSWVDAEGTWGTLVFRQQGEGLHADYAFEEGGAHFLGAIEARVSGGEAFGQYAEQTAAGARGGRVHLVGSGEGVRIFWPDHAAGHLLSRGSGGAPARAGAVAPTPFAGDFGDPSGSFGKVHLRQAGASVEGGFVRAGSDLEVGTIRGVVNQGKLVATWAGHRDAGRLLLTATDAGLEVGAPDLFGGPTTWVRGGSAAPFSSPSTATPALGGRYTDLSNRFGNLTLSQRGTKLEGRFTYLSPSGRRVFGTVTATVEDSGQASGTWEESSGLAGDVGIRPVGDGSVFLDSGGTTSVAIPGHAPPVAAGTEVGTGASAPPLPTARVHHPSVDEAKARVGRVDKVVLPLLGRLVPGGSGEPMAPELLAGRLYDLPASIVDAVLGLLEVAPGAAEHHASLSREVVQWRRDKAAIDQILAVMDGQVLTHDKDKARKGIEAALEQVARLAEGLSHRGRQRMLGDANFLNTVQYALQDPALYLRFARCFRIGGDIRAEASTDTSLDDTKRDARCEALRPVAELLCNLHTQVRALQQDPASLRPGTVEGVSGFVRAYNAVPERDRFVVELVYNRLPAVGGPKFREHIDRVVAFGTEVGGWQASSMEGLPSPDSVSVRDKERLAAAAERVQIKRDVVAARTVVALFNSAFQQLLASEGARTPAQAAAAGVDGEPALASAVTAYNRLDRPTLLPGLYADEAALKGTQGFERDLARARAALGPHASVPQSEPRSATQADPAAVKRVARQARAAEATAAALADRKKTAWTAYEQEAGASMSERVRTVRDAAGLPQRRAEVRRALPHRTADPVRGDFEVTLFHQTWERTYPGLDLDAYLRTNVAGDGALELADLARTGRVELSSLVVLCDQVNDDEDRLWREIERRGPDEWGKLLADAEGMRRLKSYLGTADFRRVDHALHGSLRVEDIVATRSGKAEIVEGIKRLVSNPALTASLGPSYVANLAADEAAITALTGALSRRETLAVLQELTAGNRTGAAGAASDPIYAAIHGATQDDDDEADLDKLIEAVEQLDDVARLALRSDPHFQRVLAMVKDQKAKHADAKLAVLRGLLERSKGARSKAARPLVQQVVLAVTEANFDKLFEALLEADDPADRAALRGVLASSPNARSVARAVDEDVMVRTRWRFENAGKARDNDAACYAVRQLMHLQRDATAVSRGPEILLALVEGGIWRHLDEAIQAKVTAIFTAGRVDGLAPPEGPVDQRQARARQGKVESQLNSWDALRQAGKGAGTEEAAIDALLDEVGGRDLLYSFSNIGDWLATDLEGLPGGEPRDYIAWVKDTVAKIAAFDRQSSQLARVGAGSGEAVAAVERSRKQIEDQRWTLHALLLQYREVTRKIMGFDLDLHERIYTARTWSEVDPKGGELRDEEGGQRLQAFRRVVRARLSKPESDPELCAELDAIGFGSLMDGAYRAKLEASYETDRGLEQRHDAAFDGSHGATLDNDLGRVRAQVGYAVCEYGFAESHDAAGLQAETGRAAGSRELYVADKARAGGLVKFFVSAATAVLATILTVATAVGGAVVMPALLGAATSAAGALVAGFAEKGVRGQDVASEDVVSQAASGFVIDFLLNLGTAGLFQVIGPRLVSGWKAGMLSEQAGKGTIEIGELAILEWAAEAGRAFRDHIVVKALAGGTKEALNSWLTQVAQHEFMGGPAPKGQGLLDFLRGMGVGLIDELGGKLIAALGNDPKTWQRIAAQIGKEGADAAAETLLAAWQADASVEGGELLKLLGKKLVLSLAKGLTQRTFADKLTTKAAHASARDEADLQEAARDGGRLGLLYDSPEALAHQRAFLARRVSRLGLEQHVPELDAFSRADANRLEAAIRASLDRRKRAILARNPLAFQDRPADGDVGKAVRQKDDFDKLVARFERLEADGSTRPEVPSGPAAPPEAVQPSEPARPAEPPPAPSQAVPPAPAPPEKVAPPSSPVVPPTAAHPPTAAPPASPVTPSAPIDLRLLVANQDTAGLERLGFRGRSLRAVQRYLPHHTPHSMAANLGNDAREAAEIIFRLGGRVCLGGEAVAPR